MGKVHIDCSSPQPCAGSGPGAGSLPASLPGLAGPPPFLHSSPPCPLPPRAGWLARSSSALGSLTHCFPPLSPPSLSRQRHLPLPWGGSGHKGARLLLSPAPGPPLHPGGPQQLFQFSDYRDRESQEPGSQTRPCQVSGARASCPLSLKVFPLKQGGSTE